MHNKINLCADSVLYATFGLGTYAITRLVLYIFEFAANGTF